MQTPTELGPSKSDQKPRKPRGAAIDETEFMKALEADPATAMQFLADEAQSDWEALAPRAGAGLISARRAVLLKLDSLSR